MLYLMPSHIYLSEAALAYFRTNDKIADVGAAVPPVPRGGRGLPRVRHGVGRDVRRRGGEDEREGAEEQPEGLSYSKDVGGGRIHVHGCLDGSSILGSRRVVA